jgi:hypothetical protein
MTTSIVISIITLCLCVSGFFFFRWYIGRKTAASELLADYRAETYRLIAEIDAAADRDSLLVEERIKTLKKLLDDTDRRIAVYMKELQRGRAGEQLYTSLGRGIRAALDSRPEQEAPLQTDLFPAPPPEKAPSPQETQNVQEVINLPRSTAIKTARGTRRKAVMWDSAETGPSAKEASSQKTAENNITSEADGKRKPKKAKIKTQIAELSAQGLSPAKIASRLKLSLAEVDLALNLLQRPKDSQP